MPGASVAADLNSSRRAERQLHRAVTSLACHRASHALIVATLVACVHAPTGPGWPRTIREQLDSAVVVESVSRDWRCGHVKHVEERWVLFSHTAIPGNSGSGLYNTRGELVGVVTGKVKNEPVGGYATVVPW